MPSKKSVEDRRRRSRRRKKKRAGRYCSNARQAVGKKEIGHELRLRSIGRDEERRGAYGEWDRLD
jgi:hypothetical protein